MAEWQEWAMEGGHPAQRVAQAHKEFQQVLDKTEKQHEPIVVRGLLR